MERRWKGERRRWAWSRWRRDEWEYPNIEQLIDDPYISSLPLNWEKQWSRINSRGTSTQWLSSLPVRTVSSGEGTISILKITRYKSRTEDSEGDSNNEQLGNTNKTFCCWEQMEEPEYSLGYLALYLNYY